MYMAANSGKFFGRNPRSNGQPPRILIVIDEQDISGLLCLVIESGGFDVATETNFKQAGERIATFTPDLLIIDQTEFDYYLQLRSVKEYDAIQVCILSTVKVDSFPLFESSDDFMVYSTDGTKIIQQIREKLQVKKRLGKNRDNELTDE